MPITLGHIVIFYGIVLLIKTIIDFVNLDASDRSISNFIKCILNAIAFITVITLLLAVPTFIAVILYKCAYEIYSQFDIVLFNI